jgi:hypothetical protein
MGGSSKVKILRKEIPKISRHKLSIDNSVWKSWWVFPDVPLMNNQKLDWVRQVLKSSATEDNLIVMLHSCAVRCHFDSKLSILSVGMALCS